jgi:hypothetical protein
MSENFSNYCAQADSSTWFCKDRRMLIPDSQKWDIVGGYCFDQIAEARPDNVEQLTQMLDAMRKDAGNPKRAEVCEEYRRVPVPMALIYNHRQGQWSDKNGGFEAQRRKIKIDPVLLIPVAELATNDRVGIIITETNPLLFLANRGDAKEENIDQVKALEQLLSLLGPALAKTTADVVLAKAATERVLTNFQQLSVKPLSEWRAADRDALSRYAAYSSKPPTDVTLKNIALMASEDRVIFLNDLQKIKDWTAAAETALDPVKMRLESLVTQRRWLQVAAQRLERGPAQLEGKLDPTLEDPASWRSAFQKLDEQSRAVKSLGSCASVFEAFGAVVSAKTEEPVTVSSAATRFMQFFNDGSQNPDPGVCAELDYDARLLESVQTIQKAAQPAAREPTNAALIKALREAQADAREGHLETVLVLLRLIAQLEANRQGIKEVVGKEEDTRKASLVLGLVGARARDAGVRTFDNKLLVTNRIYVMDEVYGSSATKIRTTPLKIALNSQSTESVPTERPKEVTTSYRFVRRGLDRLTFGVGMIASTPASSTTYTAVDPDPSTNEASTTTTTVTPVTGTVQVTTVSHPELKAIREKDRQPRSGSYALFVNERLIGRPAFGAGVQFGVATSSDNPAFLFGFSANVSEFVTVGFGQGRFRVKRLAADQMGVDVRVLNSDEIRLDTNWIRARYLSISVNISGLPLFK